MVCPRPSDDPGSLLRLLTTGPGHHVSLICDNGEVSINTFLLAALHTISRYIIDSDAATGAVIMPGVEAGDLEEMLHSLGVQSRVFTPRASLVNKLSHISLEVADNKENIGHMENGELSNRLEEFEDPNDEDDVIHVINYDHNYSGTDSKDPVIINFKKQSEVLATLNPEQKAYLEVVRRSNSDEKIGEKLRNLKSKIHGTCKFCGKVFKPRNFLVDHLWAAHGVEYKCTQCGHRTYSEIKLQMHLHYKHSIGEYIPRGKQSCQYCGKKFFKGRLGGHERRCGGVKPKVKELPCEECGKMVLENLMKSHLWRHQYFKCDNCGQEIAKLRRPKHIRRCVYKEKPVQKKTVCTICGKHISDLKAHMKVIHGEQLGMPMFQCELCDFKSPIILKLNKHMETHKPPEACKQCGAMVKNMRRHIETVHTVAEQRKHQCPDCGKGCNNKSELNNHRMNVHLKLYPFVCRYPGCDAKYNDLSNRNCHEKKKHGGRFDLIKKNNE